MNNLNNNKMSEKNINIFKIFNIINNNKFTLLLSSLFFLTISLIIVNSKNYTYVASLRYDLLADYETAEYEILNSYTEQYLGTNQYAINSENLLNEFQQVINDHNFRKKILKKIDVYKKSKKFNSFSLDEYAEIESGKFEMYPPINTKIDRIIYQMPMSPYYVATYKTREVQDTQDMITVYKILFNEVNNQVKKNFSDKIRLTIKGWKTKNLEDLFLKELESNLLIEHNIMATKSQLELYKSNYKLAQELNLDDVYMKLISEYGGINSTNNLTRIEVELESDNFKNTVFELLEQNSTSINIPYYLLGTEILAQQIKSLEIMENMTENEKSNYFPENLLSLKQDINTIKNIIENTDKQLNDQLDISLLSSYNENDLNDFRSVNYNPYSIKMSQEGYSPLIISLAIFVFGFISTLSIVLFKDLFLKNKS